MAEARNEDVLRTLMELKAIVDERMQARLHEREEIQEQSQGLVKEGKELLQQTDELKEETEERNPSLGNLRAFHTMNLSTNVLFDNVLILGRIKEQVEQQVIHSKK